jgi:ABC-type multidrug transport system permease subunit
MFYPLDPMPAWMRTVALMNPITWHTDGLRYFTIGIGDGGVVALEMGGFALFLVVSFLVAVRTLQRKA